MRAQVGKGVVMPIVHSLGKTTDKEGKKMEVSIATDVREITI
jgi:hypothetical protein